ncbi:MULTISPECIES: transporter substrate-binding domain-containing protein [unclassified Sedimentibacter]|uniref:transporter substrate-binding domain-containing protein n=1 Tax=unclassified Sedimentibacter TaxID=2649220 RepID=UPI0027E06AA3|nr:transporter substrate-binding domain-containing protein [Sedimentibacter sp. MB35-C1]WMJ76200.1 transporter substrate-binding domain-containing protein [Sedimentibacter sp. MB35-C1]
MHNSKKQWIFLMILISSSVITFAVNQFIKTVYDLNIYEYIKYSQDFSTEETEYLDEKGVLYYCTDNNAPPFSFQDKYTGRYKGFILDYVSALSIELNTQIEFVPKIWEEAVQSVVSGESDMIELFKSKEREEYLSFTKSIYKLRAIVITRSDNNEITNISDINGHKIAIEAGDYAASYTANNMPDAEIITTVDYLEAINKLLRGEVDAIIGDEPIIIYFMGDLSIEDKINILSEPLYELDICIGVTKSKPELVNILNKAILDLKKSDFAPKIQQKWFGLSTPVHKDRLNAQVMFLLIIVLLFLAAIAGWISIWTYFLKKQVKKRTIELTKSKNDLQLTFDALSDFLIVLDKYGRIEYINKSFTDMLHKNKYDLIGCSYNNIPLLDTIDIKLINKVSETVFNGRHYNYYITVLESEKNRLLISIEDNTNEIISRTQLLQQNKMIAVGQLASGLAHEIRNPLGIIRNYSYVLKSRMPYRDELMDKALTSIESAVLRASKMVENLLNFSRKNDDIKCIPLKKTINDIIALEKESITAKNVNVTVICDDSIEFYTRLESLTHIILNLLSNGIDAVSYGGTITISCSTCRNYLYIIFKDDGQGIEKHNLEHIFNPFFTTKNVGNGTGLGLFIVYNELSKINGEISVESRAGEGTEFKLKFKLEEK